MRPSGFLWLPPTAAAAWWDLLPDFDPNGNAHTDALPPAFASALLSPVPPATSGPVITISNDAQWDANLDHPTTGLGGRIFEIAYTPTTNRYCNDLGNREIRFLAGTGVFGVFTIGSLGVALDSYWVHSDSSIAVGSRGFLRQATTPIGGDDSVQHTNIHFDYLDFACGDVFLPRNYRQSAVTHCRISCGYGWSPSANAVGSDLIFGDNNIYAEDGFGFAVPLALSNGGTGLTRFVAWRNQMHSAGSNPTDKCVTMGAAAEAGILNNTFRRRQFRFEADTIEAYLLGNHIAEASDPSLADTPGLWHYLNNDNALTLAAFDAAVGAPGVGDTWVNYTGGTWPGNTWSAAGPGSWDPGGSRPAVGDPTLLTVPP